MTARLSCCEVCDRYPHCGVDCGSCDPAPYVCPGCYAVGGERCLPGCIDAEIAEELRHALESGDYERTEDEDEDERSGAGRVTEEE